MRFGEASGRLDIEFNPFTDEYLGEILEALSSHYQAERLKKELVA